jgi:hypothetical protein
MRYNNFIMDEYIGEIKNVNDQKLFVHLEIFMIR